jgi:hypothetical protein
VLTVLSEFEEMAVKVLDKCHAASEEKEQN